MSDPVVVGNEKLRVPCEVYSRIVGYLRPVRNWNAAKRQEFEDRQVFSVPDEVKNAP